MKPLAFVIATALLGSVVNANTGYGTYAKLEIDEEEVEAYYVMHSPKSFPKAMFLIEVRRVGFGPWERSMGKVEDERLAYGRRKITVTWQSGPLEGEREVLEIERGKLATWKMPDNKKSPHDGLTFSLRTERLPESVSQLVRFTNSVSLEYAVNQQ